MKITAALLRRNEACREQVDIFRTEWPNGCVVNEKNIRRAVKLDLDVHWAVEYVFPPEARHSCASKSRCAYETWTHLCRSKLLIAQVKITEAVSDVAACAWAAVDLCACAVAENYASMRKMAIAWNTYERTDASKGYLKKVKAIWKEYDKTIAPARKVYEKAYLAALLEVVADKQLMSM